MSYNVLVVDDTSFMRKMAADCLKQYGYVVIGEASNGIEAIKKYEELKPDIVMMDLTMPEMNGIDAIKEIIKSNPDAVILVCSASNQQDLIFDALDAGAKGYLMKPFNPNRMNEIIQKYAVPFLTAIDNSDSKETAETVIAIPADDPVHSHSDLDHSDRKQGSSQIKDPPVALEQAIVSELAQGEQEVAAGQTAKVAEPLEQEEQNKPGMALSEEAAGDSKEDINMPGLVRRSEAVRNFVTSYMCNWQEEINGEKSVFSVSCTENENKILIEMTGNSNEKQIVQFSLEGFRQLNQWLDNQLGGR